MWVDEDFILSSPGHFGFLEHFLGSVLEQFLVQLGMGVFAQGIGLPVGHFIRVAVHLFVWGCPQHIWEFFGIWTSAVPAMGIFVHGVGRWDTLLGLVF